MNPKRPLWAGTAVAVAGLLVAACGSSSKSASTPTTAAPAATSATTTSSATTAAGGGSTGGSVAAEYTGTGTLPAGEPDVNHDGKVIIGVMSPGDTHDHGYYESFVDSADAYAAQQGWKVITLDKIPAANAQQEADNLCRQHVDMVAIGAGELVDALQAAKDSVCQGVFFYINGGGTVPIGSTYTESVDNSVQSGYASGYAAGLVMKDKGITKAGFIAGVNAAFNREFYAPWAAGIKAALPSAQTTITYTGDQNDSAKAVEAYNALQSQGVGLIYPYLGGSTFAVAKLANQANIPVLTPGTDDCSLSSPKFAISVIFSPGDYFTAILQQFKAGTLKLGVARNWRMGIDPIPTVKYCSPTGTEAQQLASLITGIGNGSVSLAHVPTGS